MAFVVFENKDGNAYKLKGSNMQYQPTPDYPYTHEYEVAFQSGQLSFKIGVLRNPYPIGTMRSKEWQRGWDNAYETNKDIS